LASVQAQPLPNLPDETPIAVFADGVKLTMGEFKRLVAALPPENQQQAIQNRAQFLQQWGMMRKLSQMAEADKLEQTSPAKESLEYNRMVILSQAEMGHASTQVTVLPEDVSGFYETHKERYSQIKVKAIYIGFGGQKLNESAAQAKAAQIVAEARGGADFVKLVRAHSDDETSRAKDGDFATLRSTDNIPDAVKEAVFKLKERGISDPVRQPNGFYIFQADKIETRPFPQVRDEIFNELKQIHYGEWLERTKGQSAVAFPNPTFLGAYRVDTTPRK
jgi:peptidyl-prolyl cis-trans isomerase C